MPLHKGFSFPIEYIEMDKQGWFDISNFTNRDVFNQKYVWFYNMEWLSSEKILNYKYEDYQSDSVIPFALSGSNDIWGWYVDEHKSYLPIVFCPHDDDEGIYYAQNFISALFRQILEFASQNNFCIGVGEPWEMNIELARKHLMNWKNRFGKWFTNEWISEIDRLMNLELKYFQVREKPSTGDYFLLITSDECNQLIKKYLDFELLDQSFVWTV